ncbi:hypothetical protein STRATTON_19 [Erwinia phage vB_EamM_Stratton]|uniref:Uncharacterized protein n=1 Tax=Erwinia phage vB_EamM_Stratton TaxID=1883378 RepID=A0A1B2IGT5_9CAUD|nr:hypothetical protein STRATTON_19 [Erwinia phage vB_EamM_Stratton]
MHFHFHEPCLVCWCLCNQNQLAHADVLLSSERDPRSAQEDACCSFNASTREAPTLRSRCNLFLFFCIQKYHRYILPIGDEKTLSPSDPFDYSLKGVIPCHVIIALLLLLPSMV